MKGIILAGGNGTRLWPLTNIVSKQLLLIGGKPMIYYPLSTLMLMEIREIAIISDPKNLPRFQEHFGSGKYLGISLSYIEQPSPDGLAQAFILGKEFIGDDDVTLILGDNIFVGAGLTGILHNTKLLIESRQKESVIFAKEVSDPQRFGVITFTEDGLPAQIVEKPTTSISNWAIPGLYMYDNSVIEVAERVEPSSRGELEITDIHNHYLSERTLYANRIPLGISWSDAGTFQSLQETSEMINALESSWERLIGCPEEIAFNQGWITQEDLENHLTGKKGEYADYLRKLMM